MNTNMDMIIDFFKFCYGDKLIIAEDKDNPFVIRVPVATKGQWLHGKVVDLGGKDEDNGRNQNSDK